MQLVDRTQPRLALRMDDRKQRVIVTRTAASGAAFFGWEVADAAALDALAARLDAGRCRGRARQPRARRTSGTSET